MTRINSLGSSDWQHISTAPKNGLIELAVMSGGKVEVSAIMEWDEDFVNPLIGEEPGYWVNENRTLTWNPRKFGPTHWREIRGAR